MKASKLAVAALAALFAVGVGFGEDGKASDRRDLKILMIGNSFSISAIREFPSVAAAMGCDLDLSSLCIGGCSLERHWNNLMASTNAAFKPYGYERNVRGKTLFMDVPSNLAEVLRSDRWDVITLQQASHFSWKPETYVPYLDDLIAGIAKLQPQAEIVLQETWSYTPWDRRLAKWGITADEMYAKIRSACRTHAAARGLRVIPTGAAVDLYRRALPVVYQKNSFGGDPCGGRWGGEFVWDEESRTWNPGKGLDVFHLGYEGEYLQALVWTAALFGVDVTRCGYVPKYVASADRARKMKACAQAAVADCPARKAAPGTYDLVVYGSSPAALSAAVQAKRMGITCVVVSPETRIGGLTTGGLGQTDIGNKSAFGGIARDFYRDVARHYREKSSWTRQESAQYSPDGQCFGSRGDETMWTFEPSAALAILEGWEKRDGLVIHRGKRLDRSKGKVKVRGEGGRRRIESFVTEDGTEYRGKMFVDATYEGDLMAAAGVSYHVGREGNAVYGETLNGMQPVGHPHHNFDVRVDPYVVPGDPKSGLLPGVESEPMGAIGEGDRRVQAYCFRMTLTDCEENRIPFAKPVGYRELDYELLFRSYEAGESRSLPWINSRMPNRKTDTNNRAGFSTDFIGQNHGWPEASYGERERIFAAHLKYQQGLMWTLANHPRVPEEIREAVSKWGLCRDEFVATGGWTPQLYVREARRLVGDYVMTEANCVKTRVASRPVALAAYTMDSHNVRRYVTPEGSVRNEGDVEVACEKGPFGIDYGAIVPKRAECANLFVPVCLSASHIAFGSIRMEPVFFALGQASATAAAQAITAGCAVQDLPYAPLRERLLADGQVLRTEVRHVVIWQLKEDIADKAAVKAAARKGLEGLADLVPGIVSMRVETEPKEGSNADLLLDVTLATEAALEAYAKHPEHVKVAETLIKPYVRSRICFDR